MKYFSRLNVFHPGAMGLNYKPVQEAIQNMVLLILMEKLTKEQKAMLEIKNYYFWDPNRKEDGKTQGLLEHLIFDAMNATSTFSSLDHYVSVLSLHELEKYTGMVDLNSVKKEVEDINKRWGNLANFEIIEKSQGSPQLYFSLLAV